jgi:hypothetical protein
MPHKNLGANVVDRIQRGQRTFNDRMLKITYRDGKVIHEWSSPGRARYLTSRYTQEKFDKGTVDQVVVETGAQQRPAIRVYV